MNLKAQSAATGTLTANLPSLLLQSSLFFPSPSPKRSAFRNMPGTDTHSAVFLHEVLKILWLSKWSYVSCLSISCCFLYFSALSVMGTWYVTVVIIVKYIWPDKEATPVFVPTRWALLHTRHTHHLQLNAATGFLKTSIKSLKLFSPSHSSRNICLLVILPCLSC